MYLHVCRRNCFQLRGGFSKARLFVFPSITHGRSRDRAQYVQYVWERGAQGRRATPPPPPRRRYRQLVSGPADPLLLPGRDAAVEKPKQLAAQIRSITERDIRKILKMLRCTKPVTSDKKGGTWLLCPSTSVE